MKGLSQVALSARCMKNFQICQFWCDMNFIEGFVRCNEDEEGRSEHNVISSSIDTE